VTDLLTIAAAPCQHCARAAQGTRTGRYHLHCVTCCARLVRSCRPWRDAQEAMFAIIMRQPGRPVKADVITAIKGMDQQQGAGCRSV